MSAVPNRACRFVDIDDVGRLRSSRLAAGAAAAGLFDERVAVDRAPACKPRC